MIIGGVAEMLVLAVPSDDGQYPYQDILIQHSGTLRTRYAG